MIPAETPDALPVTTAAAAEPEDLLAAWVGRAQLSPAVDRAIVRWLDRELKEDQYARLEQAGHSVEDAIPLAPVFIDLAAFPGPTDEANQPFSPEHGFLHQALGLEPQALAGNTETMDVGQVPGPSRRRRERPSKGIALVGGPGQGKSTVGQLP
ncbi:MAG: hypothetical protein ABJE95_31755 [Byssovorax sp.]